MSLFRIMASVLSPLVLVIDDLQWADTASVELLESILSNREIENVMVIGIFRSNEVDDTHILSKTLRDIRSATRESNTGLSIIEFEIGNLDIDAVNEMLAFLLSTDDRARVRPLAEISYKKTAGNPFYLTHFLSRLHEMRMLSYDHELMDWTWDEQSIELYTQATDNVVDLLTQSMTSLSQDHQTLLSFASFLGSNFQERPLFILWKAFRKRNPNKRRIFTSKNKAKKQSTCDEEYGNKHGQEDDAEGKQHQTSSHFKNALKFCLFLKVKLWLLVQQLLNL